MDFSDTSIVESIPRSGSVLWRNSSAGSIFSQSSHAEEDEVALHWAALEKLPTYDRIRKGILKGIAEGEIREVDIQHLGTQDKKTVLDRLVKVADEDHEKFLLKIRNRIKRLGIELPTIEVRFQNLNVDTEAYIGSRGVPTIPNFIFNIFEGLLNSLHILPSQKKRISILHDVSGIIKPSRTTLLLGPPGAGKTTLLLALAGKLDKQLKVSGSITYNGHGMKEFVPQRTSAYTSQHDVHIGEMTVRETLAFSARCQGVGSRYELFMELSRREKQAHIKPDPDLDVYMKAAALTGQKENVVTDYILKILGLEVCADTMVGNQMLRGVSGGQKKRVTTGEMLVGPSKALFMDEISTGLDSSTTYQIVNSLRHSIQILGGTAVIALLQPPPETYELFDDIILLSNGYVVYQGPRENVLEFFESMGFKCPGRKGVADFLQEVTSRKDQQQYWARQDEPYRYIPVKEFAESFQSFHIGCKLQEELGTPFDKRKSHPAALTTSEYGISKKELLKACMSREWLLMKRNSFAYIFKMGRVLVMALITMTVFLHVTLHHDSNDGSIYLGALYYGLVILMFNGLSEIAMTIGKLPILYKQRDLHFYPSWAYALPVWILRIPVSIVEVAIWVVLTYYTIGFDPNVGRFFKQYLLLFLVSQMASGLFRAIGALGRTMIIANTFGFFSLFAILVLGGYVMSRENVKKWWIWGYWISPLMYGLNGITTNEFLGHSWKHFAPNSTESLGVQILKARGIFTKSYWYWIGVGAMIGYMLLFNAIFTVALTFLNPLASGQTVITEDVLKENEANITGEVGERALPSRGRGNGSIDNEIERTQALESASSSNKKGMVLPFTPLAITFDDVKYSVNMPPEMKAQGFPEDRLELLKGVSGAFRPGLLTALMGISGAGKTTLMDVLAGRKTGGYIEGSINISGYPKKQETFARVSGYCEQNDIHSPHLTVYESLFFSAWLRLPVEVDSSKRKMFIQEVMELVELTPLRESLVGLPGVSGLSTEQRKRLTIAVELVANPSMIFMDEPTSGLDARAAAIVMRTVRNTVDTGRTVLCTIHQPSIDIFEAFDELFLLKRGGEVIYAGPLGHHSSQMIRYFESITGLQKIKNGSNPATWMLEVSSIAQEEALGVNFAEIYKNSDLFRRNKSLIQELSSPPPRSKDLYFPSRYSLSFFQQCIACLWKQRISYWRNPQYTAVRFIFTIAIALMFGSQFWGFGSKLKTPQHLLNAMGSMYASVVFYGAQNASSVQPVVAIERTVFYRERAAGMYSHIPYAFAQMVIELPYIFVQTVAYGVIVYAMIQFEWTAAKFFWYLFFMFFTFMYFTYYGMMIIGMTPNHEIATIVSSAFYALWNLFAGFILPHPKIPVWWRWYYWICPVSWTLYGLVTSQFGDREETMDNGQTVSEFVRSYLGLRHDFLGLVAAVVIVFGLVFAFVFAFSTKVFNFQRR